MQRGPIDEPLRRVVLPYLAFAGLWILLSDRLLEALVSDPAARIQWSIYKGWAFVAVTAAVLYGLLRVELSARAGERRGRREAEAASRSERDFSEAVLDSLPGVVYCHDQSLRFVRWNESLERVTGRTRDEIGRLSPLDLVAPSHRAALEEQIRQVFAARTSSVEVDLLAGDGSEIPYYLTAVAVPIDGRPHLVGVGIDITDRRRAEEQRLALDAQLRQAQKMESVGRLAGGVAHDFNNALGVILGYAELAMRALPPTDPMRHHLDEVRDAASRSANLTRQLLAFARKQTIAPRLLDLNEAVSGMLAMLRRLIGEDVSLEWLPAASIWPVKVDPAQVDQILANLLVNARDAIGGVGRITVETANRVVREGEWSGRVGCAPGEYVTLSVSDDGAGMERDVLEHVFEPFFTTKPAGRGTGLGLATVYGIVTQNGGFLDVTSQPGQGSTFRILLPRAHGDVPNGLAPLATAEPVGRGETVLLVEDEPAMLEVAADMLADLNYVVLSADRPKAALSLVGSHPEIRLLVTDVVMPEMNGRELAERVVASLPGARCLFVSGYTTDVIAHHGVLDEGILFLAKPFSRRELATKVRQALDG